LPGWRSLCASVKLPENSVFDILRIMENFISPSVDITDPSSVEWKHFANLSADALQKRWDEPIGIGMLNSLRGARFSRDVIEKNVGKFAGKFDLRGINLSKENLERFDLSEIDFFASNLTGARCKAANFSGSYLSHCDICGTSFEWANFSETTLDNVKFDKQTSFIGVDLHKVNFNLATLLYDLALSQQRIQQLEQHYKFFARFLRLSCDYGRSFSRYILWVTAFVVSYALVYFF
jgi:hypothetical protein